MMINNEVLKPDDATLVVRRVLKATPELAFEKMPGPALADRLVVVAHVVDASAHRIAPHHAGIVGLQEFGRRSDIRHSGVEPNVVAVWVEDDWHSVLDN